jgi:molybdopterin converting factor subunit 1
MRVQLRLFASYREIVGAGQLPWTLREGATLGELVDAVVAAHPGLRGHRETMFLAVNRAYAQSDAVLRDGDEVALLPPVSGGLE